MGWKLVSFRPSKPTPNSIWGTEQLPKLTPAAAVAAGVVTEETTYTVEVTGTSLHVDAGLRTVSVESNIISC